MSPRKANLSRPYYLVSQEYDSAHKAFEDAASMLYASASSLLSLREHFENDMTLNVALNHLQKEADNYNKVVLGDL